MTRRVAAIDLGTNSTRLLVADADDGRLKEVERLLAITRLGEGVDTSRGLAEPAVARVDAQVGRYIDRARELGAETVLAIATSAVRDAANGGEFLAGLERRHGIRTMLLAGEDEARMTFRGVTSARPLSGEAVICDIGGGSTELIAGDPQGVDYAVSLDMGCVRMSERFLRADPPTGEEIAALRRLVDAFSAFAKLPKVEVKPLDLATLVDDAARDVPGDAFAPELEPPPSPVTVLGDRLLLRRVLTNLVDNAREAGAKKVRIAWGIAGGKAQLTVDDDGPGVPQALAGKLFDPYVTSKEHGTGLGLAIAKKTALEHGGTLTLARAPSPLGGARFVLVLPTA